MTNKFKSKGVLSSVFISYTLMKWSSKNWVFMVLSSFTLRSEPDKLLKNCPTFAFKFINLSLCWLKNASVMELRLVKGTYSPMSRSRIIRTRLSWRVSELAVIEAVMISQFSISIRAWINKLIFWKKGFLSCIVL